MLVPQTEEKLGKRLKTADLQILAGLYDDLGLPADVIYLLVCHCVARSEERYGPGRRPTLRQIEKEGYHWAQRGLFDQESASRYLRDWNVRRSAMSRYMQVLGLGDRRPVESEERYITDWMDKGFPPETVALAYDKTVFYKKELNWRYLNGILRPLARKRLAHGGGGPPERQPQALPAGGEEGRLPYGEIHEVVRRKTPWHTTERCCVRPPWRFDEDKQRRQEQQRQRQQQVYQQCPELESIQREIRGTMGEIIASALRRGTDPLPAIRVIRDKNLSLQRRRAELLAQLGYPEDYLSEKPRCPCAVIPAIGATACAAA